MSIQFVRIWLTRGESQLKRVKSKWAASPLTAQLGQSFEMALQLYVPNEIDKMLSEARENAWRQAIRILITFMTSTNLRFILLGGFSLRQLHLLLTPIHWQSAGWWHFRYGFLWVTLIRFPSSYFFDSFHFIYDSIDIGQQRLQRIIQNLKKFSL